MSRSHNVPHLSDIPNPSALVSLQFTNRNRTSLEGLPKFKNLTDLDISKNQLTGKEVELASLRYLKRLNLSRNDFETIEELPKTLEHLNLSSNRIQSLNDFSCLSRLHTLNLTNNCISTLEPLSSVQTLR
jgi:Leucine-rich repeat (LRR) protein